MLEFVVFSAPWKNRYVDPRGVLLGDAYGQQAHLAFIAGKNALHAWAHVDRHPISSQVLLEQLQSFISPGQPARIYAKASLRNQLSKLGSSNWEWPAPRSGGENASGFFSRFDSLVSFSLGQVTRREPDEPVSLLKRESSATTLRNGMLWENQFSLDVWNEKLRGCPQLLCPPTLLSSAQQDLDHISVTLHLELERDQRKQPPLPLPAKHTPPPPVVHLDGVAHYPRSVDEALTRWHLGASTQRAVKNVPWPQVRSRVIDAARALEPLLRDEGPRVLSALIHGNQSWVGTMKALADLEELAVWEATFPRYEFIGDLSWEREERLRQDPCIAELLGPMDLSPGLPKRWESLVHRFLTRRFPVADLELASAGQMMFCSEALSQLDQFTNLSADTRKELAKVLLGLDERGIANVRFWRDDSSRRKEGYWSLTDTAADAANQALWDALGNAPGRWIRLEELVARLKGSDVWARSYLLEGTLSPALVAQACIGSDCRILLSQRPSDNKTGPVVRGLVCTEPVARKVVQAGWLDGPERFTATDKDAVIADTGPLPARNCAFFSAMDNGHEFIWAG